MTNCLECEVRNGGHHQFFWNSGGALIVETLEDLQLIRAAPFAEIFVKAQRIYEAHDYEGEKLQSANSWEAFTAGYREERMEELDSAFDCQPKSIKEYIGEFIRSHPDVYA